MRQETRNIYQFNELSEKAKENALKEMYDINILSGWWDEVYDDAEQIGLQITEFALDRGNMIDGVFLEPGIAVANNIINDHGELTDTHQTAQRFMVKYRAAQERAIENGADLEEFEAGYLEAEFLRNLLGDYKRMLRENYDYRMSDEAIIETITANEYEFLGNGASWRAREVRDGLW